MRKAGRVDSRIGEQQEWIVRWGEQQECIARLGEQDE